MLLLVAPATFAGPHGGTRVTVNTNTNYTTGVFPNTGQFLGFLGAFGGACAGTSGVDYTSTMSILPATFPNNTVISWRWPPFSPVIPCGLGVWSYLQVSYGNYSGSTFMQVTAKQVSAISTLTQTHAIRVGGSTADFDIIDDVFLTAASGDFGQQLHEIEVILAVSQQAIDFAASGTTIGTTTISGISWDVSVVAQTPRDVVFIRSDHANVLSATIDIKAMFAYLIAHGEVATTEWYNGHGLGSEQTKGSGSLTIDQFSVVYN